MNFLNKITLINSANIPYREVQLNGNIHFIGTQGTGKSTMLRAVLFFYTAESRKLGISKEKKSFAEYYFPHIDSYVIYEVQRGDRKYCAWLYKHQNRLVFRFIDGQYHKDCFITDNRASTQAETILKYSNKGISLSPPIYNFTDFRNIIYGANPDMKHFSITENKSYQNIPRTISNVFLNSSLDATFIKQTIIQSLSDDPFAINLDANRHHLESARQDYLDVKAYQQHEKSAQNIVTLYDDILALEKHRKETAWKAGGAFNYSMAQIKVMDESCQILGKQHLEQKNKIQQITREYEELKSQLKDKLAVIKRDIKTAKQKQKEYSEQNIDKILEESRKESLYRQQQSQYIQQKELLTKSLSEIEAAFANTITKLENELQGRINKIHEEAADKKLKLQQARFDAEKLELNKETICRNEYLEKKSIPEKEIIRCEKEKTRLESEIDHLNKTPFDIKESKELKEDIQSLLQEKIKLQARCESLENSIVHQQQKGENEQKTQQYKFRELQQSILHKKQKMEQSIESIENDLKSLEGSLVEFLDLNVEGWKYSIGKTASRDLLLRGDLNPIKDKGDSFFGIKLNLEAIEPIDLSKLTLSKALKDNQDQMELLRKELKKLQNEEEDEQNKITKKYNKLIAHDKEKLNKATLQLEKTVIEIEKKQMELSELISRAEIQKQEIKKQLSQQLLDINASINSEKENIKVYTEQLTQRLKVEKILSKKHIEEIHNSLQELSLNTQKQVDDLKEDAHKQITELHTQRTESLHNKGVDTQKLDKLENSLLEINELLQKIEFNKRLVFNYEKDYQEYISKLSDFENQRKEAQDQLTHQRKLYEKDKERHDNHLSEILGKLNGIQKQRESHDREIQAMETFQKESLYNEMQSLLEHHDTYSKESCSTLINTLKNQALEFEKQDKKLSERITLFAGYFNENNCLKFDVNISSQIHARSFAENLREFVKEQKIVDFRTEVSRKYAMVLESIVNETNDLLVKEQDIDAVISRINSDFKQSNFVGVVRSIEMRLQQSSNRVIQILRKIQAFQNDKLMNFGEINLFNQGGSDSNDQQAVELLESLQRRISEQKQSHLKLEDAFELEFRIRENENDTNWVNRLSNVGSNGTDVLVKSMIYINLLNIFKHNGNNTNKETILHCLIDEVGILHDSNVKGLINFAAERNIWLINGSPNSHNEQDYKHIYIFRKNKENNQTGIAKLISNEI